MRLGNCFSNGLRQIADVRFQHGVDADESEMIKRAVPYIQQKLGQTSPNQKF